MLRHRKCSSCAKAPGKVILTGEHSVVYGGIAIAGPIDQWLKLEIIQTHKLSSCKEHKYFQYIKKIVAESFKFNLDTLDYVIINYLPMRSGLGSSAAFAAASIQAILNLYKIKIDKERLFELTLEAEKFMHGNPSGIDPAVVIYQEFIKYSKGQGIKIVTRTKPLEFVLINSDPAIESTKDMVELVARRKKLNPKIDFVLNEMKKVSLRIYDTLGHGYDFKKLMSLINDNHNLLVDLGVVGQKAFNIIRTIQDYQGVAKITGAGGVKTGSGFILALHDDLNYLSEKLKFEGIDLKRVFLG